MNGDESGDGIQQLKACGIEIGPSTGEFSGPAVEACVATILQGARALSVAMGGTTGLRHNLAGVSVKIKKIRYNGIAVPHGITYNPVGLTTWTVVHEMGHAWDGANRWHLSWLMQQKLRAGQKTPLDWLRHIFQPDDSRYWYLPGDGPPPCGIDRNFNAKEDFAEAVTAYVFPEEAKTRASERGWPYDDPSRGYVYADFHATPRGNFLGQLMKTGSPG